MSVAKLAIALIIPLTMAQASLLPPIVEPWWTIGPMPLARTIAQMKNEIPATGTKYALAVKRCRIFCTGNHRKGSDPAQNKKKLTKSLVFVPLELGMELLAPPVP